MVLGNVHRYLPAIGGVRLLDVDAEKFDAISEAPVDLVQAARLNPEGGSGVGAKGEGHGAPAKCREPHALVEPSAVAVDSL